MTKGEMPGTTLLDVQLERLFPPDQTVVLTNNLDQLMILLAHKAGIIAHELGINPEEVTVAQLQAWEKSHQS